MIPEKLWKIELGGFIFLLILFFKPLGIILFISGLNLYPSEFYLYVLISLAFLTLLEYVSLIIPLKGFRYLKRRRERILHTLWIAVVICNAAFSFYVVLESSRV